MNTNLSQVSHYRNEFKEKSDGIVLPDKKVWKYKDELIKAVKKTIEDNSFRPILDWKHEFRNYCNETFKDVLLFKVLKTQIGHK